LAAFPWRSEQPERHQECQGQQAEQHADLVESAAVGPTRIGSARTDCVPRHSVVSVRVPGEALLLHLEIITAHLQPRLTPPTNAASLIGPSVSSRSSTVTSPAPRLSHGPDRGRRKEGMDRRQVAASSGQADRCDRRIRQRSADPFYWGGGRAATIRLWPNRCCVNEIWESWWSI
jgi:hypothetical protein